MDFGSQDDLIARLAYTLEDDSARPLAFLTGSGLSVPSVPGVAATLQILRKSLPAPEQAELDSVLAEFKESGEKYRQAFQFLGLRRPSNFAERVLKLATLRAFNTTGRSENEWLGLSGELEAQVDSWKIPPGQAALGRILAGLPGALRGPVFTTNFDPLTEIAVRQAGGVATTHIHADDSSFIANLRVQTGTSVVHLHGFWRDSAVLNTADQLAQDRPSLTASLRVILERHTLVVIGYGGWSDVITRSLLEAVANQQSHELDVLWCVHSSARDLHQSTSGQTGLDRFPNAPGNIKFYAGVDANSFLPALEKRLEDILTYRDEKRTDAMGSSLVGWNTMTSQHLLGLADAATESSALSFFDGRLPAWHDAINPHIPIRDAAVGITSQIRVASQTRSSSMTILSGPSGEGKTTIALQVAGMLATDSNTDFRVFTLEGDYFGTVQSILGLPKSSSYVLVVDDGHKFVSRIQELVTAINDSGHVGLHILVVSGDTDWSAAGGSNFHWQRFLKTTIHTIQGINHVDASSMVSAWEKLGDQALGDLAHYSSSTERVEALLDYSFGEGVAGKGTLLGALLTTRYDRQGLREHIRQLMDRLRSRLVPAGNRPSLLEALIAIAVPHAYGVLELDAEVLADAFGLTKVELNAYVLIPLGDEAAITYTSGRIVVRHELIADAIVDLCLEHSYDLEAVTVRIVRAAANRMQTIGYSGSLSSIAYLSSKISDIPKLALAAAKAALDAVPSRLSYRTSMSAVLRRNHETRRASEQNEEALRLIFNADNSTQVRGFLIEWGVVEGSLGNFARNAVLAGLALQDGSALGKLNDEQSQRAVACLLLALRRMQESDPDPDVLLGLAAATVIARELRSPPSLDWLRAAERVVEKSDLRFPKFDGEAQIERALKSALNAALQRLESDFPPNFPRTEFTFRSLRELVR